MQCVDEHECCLIGIDQQPHNGKDEHMGVLLIPQHGGLSPMPSSTFPFIKSTIVEATSIA